MIMVLGFFFFLLGLLGNDGGSMFGYNGCLVVGYACVVGRRLICRARLVVLWVAVLSVGLVVGCAMV